MADASLDLCLAVFSSLSLEPKFLSIMFLYKFLPDTKTRSRLLTLKEKQE